MRELPACELAAVLGGRTKVTVGFELGPWKADLFTIERSDRQDCINYQRSQGRPVSDCKDIP
jgi:hypothetical protein